MNHSQVVQASKIVQEAKGKGLGMSLPALSQTSRSEQGASSRKQTQTSNISP